jgi:hypothetical protein
VPYLEINESVLREMVLHNPAELVALANRLGRNIGSAKEPPMVLLSRLIDSADGFRVG